MKRPLFCQLCHRAVPASAPMARMGAYWACAACHGDRIVFCPEGEHDYGGAVDTQGSLMWCCRRPGCGVILGHQAVSETGVEAAPETGDIDF